MHKMNHSAGLTSPNVASNGNLVQLAIGALVVLWAGNYWHTHMGETHLMVSGAAVHLYGLGLLVSAAWQLAGATRLRQASERVLLLSGFVVWAPVMVIGLRSIGFDLWNASPSLVLGSLAASVGLGGLVAWRLT